MKNLKGICKRCGNLTDETEPMDFGRFIGQIICISCWDTECESAWTRTGEDQ